MMSGSEVAATQRIPKDKIVLKDGQVMSIEHFFLCNNVVGGSSVTRNADGTFTFMSDDPEHGGYTRTGDLVDVLKRHHAEIVANYRAVLSTSNPTDELIQKHFPNYEIVRC